MASSYGEDASKSALRSSYEAVSAKLAPAHAERVDREIRIHFTAMAAYRNAPLILAYVTYRVCDRGKLVFYEIETLEGMRAGSRGVLEPDPAKCTPISDDDLEDSICLVPGLVFDAEGYRIGYGAGYYDNYLANYPGLKVGLVRALRISSNPLPHDDHDVPMDVLVSDGSVWVCDRGIKG